MNPLDLDAFLVIAECENLTEAAEKLFISQPALTKRLNTLENRLGCRLVERGKGVRSIVLTEQGNAFMEMAVKYRHLENEMLDLRNKERRRQLTIYSSDGPHLYTLAEAYKEYARRHPDTALRLITGDYPRCFEAIRNREAELAFIGANYYDKEILSVPIYSEPMFFICRTESSYPDSVSPKMLNTDNAIFSPYSSDFTKWWDYWFGKHKTPFFIEAHLIAQVEDLLLSFHKDIWTIVPASVRNDYVKNPRLRSGKIEETPPERIVYMVRNIHGSESIANEFLALIRDRLHSIEGIKYLL